MSNNLIIKFTLENEKELIFSINSETIIEEKIKNIKSEYHLNDNEINELKELIKININNKKNKEIIKNEKFEIKNNLNHKTFNFLENINIKKNREKRYEKSEEILLFLKNKSETLKIIFNNIGELNKKLLNQINYLENIIENTKNEENKIPYYEKLFNLHKEYLNKLNKKQIEKSNRTDLNCTFKPEIDKVSEILDKIILIRKNKKLEVVYKKKLPNEIKKGKRNELLYNSFLSKKKNIKKNEKSKINNYEYSEDFINRNINKIKIQKDYLNLDFRPETNNENNFKFLNDDLKILSHEEYIEMMYKRNFIINDLKEYKKENENKKIDQKCNSFIPIESSNKIFESYKTHKINNLFNKFKDSNGLIDIRNNDSNDFYINLIKKFNKNNEKELLNQNDFNNILEKSLSKVLFFQKNEIVFGKTRKK